MKLVHRFYPCRQLKVLLAKSGSSNIWAQYSEMNHPVKWKYRQDYRHVIVVCHGLNALLKTSSLSTHLGTNIYNTLLQPVLCECATWSVTKQDLNTLMIFERKVLRKICGPLYDNESAKSRISHNRELCDVYKEPNIVTVMKTRRPRWARHFARMRNNRRPKTVLNTKPTGRRSVGRLTTRWSDCVSKDLQRVWLLEEWQKGAQDRLQCRQSAHSTLGLIV